MIPMTLAETAAFLSQHDNYLLFTHRRPDGDTIGSAAALCRGLRALGKHAVLFENPQFTEKFRPYLDGLTAKELPVDALFISVDIAAGNLMPLTAEAYADKIDLRIDHHGRDSGFGKQGYVDATAAACGEIILKLLQLLNAPIDAQTAQALYCAISTDTGCFRYSNVTARTLRAAAECMDYGADTFAVNQVMFLTKRFPRLQLEAYLTQTTEFYADGIVAVSAIPEALRVSLGLGEDDIDDISGFAREIAGVEIGVMLRELGTQGKISVRTSPRYDASEICALLGGGGHRAAAGATVEGGIEGAKRAVLQAIKASGVKL